MQEKDFVPFKLWHKHGYVNRFFASCGQEGEETETLELFAGCKQGFRSQQRKHRDHSRFYLRRKSNCRSTECEKKNEWNWLDSGNWI